MKKEKRNEPWTEYAKRNQMNPVDWRKMHQIVSRMIAGELEDSGGGLTGLNSKPASFVLVGVHGHRCFIKFKLIRIVNTWTGFYDLYMTHVGL